jgi:hypothetical protein
MRSSSCGRRENKNNILKTLRLPRSSVHTLVPIQATSIEHTSEHERLNQHLIALRALRSQRPAPHRRPFPPSRQRSRLRRAGNQRTRRNEQQHQRRRRVNWHEREGSQSWRDVYGRRGKQQTGRGQQHDEAGAGEWENWRVGRCERSQIGTSTATLSRNPQYYLISTM